MSTLIEYVSKTIGIDITSPRLSWILGSDERSQTQTAYQIQVASSPSKLGVHPNISNQHLECHPLPVQGQAKRDASGLQRMHLWMLERVMPRSMASATLVGFISEFARQLNKSRICLQHAVTISRRVPEALRTVAVDPVCPVFLPESDYLLYLSLFDY